MADQTMKKALIKGAVARLVAKMASSSAYGKVLTLIARFRIVMYYENIV